MKLDVPEVLKMFLVDDWEAVTKNNQVGLPFVFFFLGRGLTWHITSLYRYLANPMSFRY